MVFSQSTPRFRHGTDFSSIKQLDSTAWILVPVQWKNNGKIANIKIEAWRDKKNVLFYNPDTDENRMLFTDSVQIIREFTGHLLKYRSPTDTTRRPPNKLFIYYKVTNHDYNGDNKLDSDDPVYLYHSNFNGHGLERITPVEHNLKEYEYFKDQNIILALLERDINKDREFDEKDAEILYKIDLNDLSKSRVISVMTIQSDGK